MIMALLQFAESNLDLPHSRTEIISDSTIQRFYHLSEPVQGNTDLQELSAELFGSRELRVGSVHQPAQHSANRLPIGIGQIQQPIVMRFVPAGRDGARKATLI
ncbi:hypothetical protein GGQ97_001540 [Sphingomonas kaistensis]|uniref:Uncharacterized protein n=1 Tax=Sphingomonas kaistensis TaxID=298708 RepID=A0A7X5Y704_9SPHN|nr:hypothetical protein [Sphingomonas kaistensis]NJC05747.1 hypothetical protein [Sphingomonas kaistensis]